jgi:excisionase family DNA binding protein
MISVAKNTAEDHERPHDHIIAYSVKEACRVSSLGRTTVYAAISAGRLRATRVGGRTLIPADSLRALIAGEA